MTPYADTSFLLSLYVAQVHSPAANAWMQQAQTGLLVTELSLTELVNGLNLAVYRKEIDATICDRARQEVEKDFASGVLVRALSVWPEIFAETRRLSDQHCAAVGLRTLDVLHLACAQALGATVLLSFDARQRSLAATLGLDVKP